MGLIDEIYKIVGDDCDPRVMKKNAEKAGWKFINELLIQERFDGEEVEVRALMTTQGGTTEAVSMISYVDGGIEVVKEVYNSRHKKLKRTKI